MDSKFEPISSSTSSSSTDDLLKAKQEAEEYYDNFVLSKHRQKRSPRRFIVPIVLHLFLITIYTLTTLYLLDQNNKKWDRGPDLIYCIIQTSVNSMLECLLCYSAR